MSQTRPTKKEIDTYSADYVLYGDQSRAWRATFPKSKAAKETINVKASIFHSIDNVQIRISVLSSKAREIADKNFDIDAEWVLKASVDLLEKCMGTKTISDENGKQIAKAKFQPMGAGKAIELIGKNVGVNAFSENLNIKEVSELSPWGSIKASVDKIKEDD